LSYGICEGGRNKGEGNARERELKNYDLPLALQEVRRCRKVWTLTENRKGGNGGPWRGRSASEPRGRFIVTSASVWGWERGDKDLILAKEQRRGTGSGPGVQRNIGDALR